MNACRILNTSRHQPICHHARRRGNVHLRQGWPGNLLIVVRLSNAVDREPLLIAMERNRNHGSEERIALPNIAIAVAFPIISSLCQWSAREKRGVRQMLSEHASLLRATAIICSSDVSAVTSLPERVCGRGNAS